MSLCCCGDAQAQWLHISVNSLTHPSIITTFHLLFLLLPLPFYPSIWHLSAEVGWVALHGRINQYDLFIKIMCVCCAPFVHLTAPFYFPFFKHVSVLQWWLFISEFCLHSVLTCVMTIYFQISSKYDQKNKQKKNRVSCCSRSFSQSLGIEHCEIHTQRPERAGLGQQQ